MPNVLPKLIHAGQRALVQKIPAHQKLSQLSQGKKIIGKKPPTPKRKVIPPTKKRLYVLDTNVFMHDPSCLFRFQEHDIYITSVVFEELDNNKTGDYEKSRNARDVSRKIEQITSPKSVNLKEGAPLIAFSGGRATGRLFLQMNGITAGIDEKVKADNQILAQVTKLITDYNSLREVVLVSKDTNMRIKARAQGLLVEDYHSDMVMTEDDKDFLPSGTSDLPNNFWETHETEARKEGSTTYYKVIGPAVKKISVNEFISTSDGKPFTGRVIEKKGNLSILEIPTDYMVDKNKVFGINARNMKQSFAFNLLLDPNVHLVILIGVAGSGKTLLALGAGLMQTIEMETYNGIIVTRATVSIGEDIGFLPGTEEDKMGAWMGGIDDNLEVIDSVEHLSTHVDKKEHQSSVGHAFNNARNKKHKDSPPATEAHSAKEEMKKKIREKIRIKSLNYMRGRSLFKKYVIIDEAQNLTPKQIKTLITRAGPGTKMVVMGNLAQIDTPYLTEGGSGLTYLVNCFKDSPVSGHIILPDGVRSILATEANALL
jgi:PhoH-like ATPase